MESNRLKNIENEIGMLRKAIENMQEYLIDDEAGLEVSDEVVREVEEARKSGDEIPHEDVVKEFLE